MVCLWTACFQAASPEEDSSDFVTRASTLWCDLVGPLSLADGVPARSSNIASTDTAQSLTQLVLTLGPPTHLVLAHQPAASSVPTAPACQPFNPSLYLGTSIHFPPYTHSGAGVGPEHSETAS